MSSPPLRVVMASARFWPELGGVETHLRELSTRLVAAGVHVRVAATDRTGRLAPREWVDGVEVLRFPAWPADRDLYLSPRLARFVTHADADVIHVQGFHTLVAPLAMFAARIAGRPYVVSLHTGGHSSRVRTAIRPVQAAVLAPLIRGAAAIICGSRWEARRMSRQLGVPESRMRVIPSGVDVPPGIDAPVEPDLIVSPGRLERYKGHDRVIRALPHLAERHPNVRLRIVGDGPAAGELERLATRLGVEDRVRIGPIHDRREFTAVLASAAAVVSLSDYESQGLAAWEAVAQRRPTVVTTTTALGELVATSGARGVAPRASSRDIADAVLEAMASPMGPAVAIPTWDECAEKVLAVYRDIVEPGSAARG